MEQENEKKKGGFYRRPRHGQKRNFHKNKKPLRAPQEKDEVKEETVSTPASPVPSEALPEISKMPPVAVQEKTTGSEETRLKEIDAEKAASFETPASEEQKQYEVVGVRFRPVGKTYSFDPQSLTLKIGDHIVVETSQGLELGVVSTDRHSVCEKELVLPLKKVVRLATDDDIRRSKENRELEIRAKKVFLQKIQEHELDMALSDVECSFDKSKIIFYFTSEGRVDFRELVKDMASVFKTRIELRQIGVRDEAKQLGGLGICGRPLCCSTFLEDFQQVSIKMAKEQNLSLNPTKISGTCRRLMCCLRYENDVYVEASKKCPKADSPVMTPQGRGVVTEANVLSGKCKVRLDADPDNLIPFAAEDLKILPKQKKNPPQGKETREKSEKEKDAP